MAHFEQDDPVDGSGAVDMFDDTVMEDGMQQLLEPVTLTQPKRKDIHDDEEEQKVPPTKKTKASAPSANVVHRFDATQHFYQLDLAHFAAFKDVLAMLVHDKDAIVSFVLADNCLTVYNFAFTNGVFIIAQFKSEYFKHVQSDRQVRGAQSMSAIRLYKQLERLSVMGCSGLILRAAEEQLSMHGIRQDDQAAIVTTVGILEDESPIMPDWKGSVYPVEIQLDAKMFTVAVNNAIGTIFTLKVDTDKKALIMYSEENNDGFEVPIHLGPEAVSEIEKFPHVKSFNAVFKKAHFVPIIRGVKVNNMLSISFMNEAPLRIRYNITKGENFDENNDSSVLVWIGSHNV